MARNQQEVELQTISPNDVDTLTLGKMFAPAVEVTEADVVPATEAAGKVADNDGAKPQISAYELRSRILEIIAGYLQNSDVRETQKSVMILNAVAGDIQVIDLNG